MRITDAISHAWSIFSSKPESFTPRIGRVNSTNPDRIYLTGGNERSFISALYDRIAIDVAAIAIKHCRVDEHHQYISDVDSKLNRCLTISSNIDQTPRAFIQDLVLTMFDEGVAVIVPTDTDVNPDSVGIGGFDVEAMRVGRVREWQPDNVKVEVYNDNVGERQQIYIPKRMAAIIENPLYSIMNEPNSTLKRLIRKLNLLDAIDEQSGSGKMDLIIQLPYTIRSEARRQEAEKRRKSIEEQLVGSKYGIAYADATEHITQLNRPVENNLLDQVKYLTTMVYGQLGISENVANGSGSDAEILNYYNKTIEPIVSAICDSMRRTFLTKTAISQGQDIMFFKDPFRLVTIDKIATVADTFTRNEIMSSNEIRSIIGLPRVDDPGADELRNKNLNRQSGTDQDDYYDDSGEYQDYYDDSDDSGEVSDNEISQNDNQN